MLIFLIIFAIGYGLAYVFYGLVAIMIELGFFVSSMTLNERIVAAVFLIAIVCLARKVTK